MSRSPAAPGQGPLLDLAQLLRGHLKRHRRIELQDVATKPLRDPESSPRWTLDVLNLTLRARAALADRLYLRPRRLASRVAFRFGPKRARARGAAADPSALSLLCPTRERVARVDAFVRSVYKTAVRPERIELLFYVDDDDPTLPDYAAFFDRAARRFPRFRRCAMHVGPPIPVPKAWNVLAARCEGDFLLMANDDQVYVDYGWDVLLDAGAESVAQEFSDRVYCLYFDAGQYPEGEADFPVVSRGWYEALGYFVPELFEYWETEGWTFGIARRLDRLRAVEGVLVEHRHYQDYKSPFDVTYQRHRTTRDKAFRDHLLFLRTEPEREREAERLRREIGKRSSALAGAEGRAMGPAATPEARKQSDTIRKHYAGLISALAADGQLEAVRECAELAVEQGVWGDPAQRPLQWLPSVPARPLYDTSEFWFAKYLEDNYAKIRAEVDLVTGSGREGFLPVEEPLLARGRWDQVVFYEAGHRFAHACERFPVTAQIVAGIPEATTFGPGVVTLSWLDPDTHIVPHCGRTNAQLRVHLGIRIPEGCWMRVGEETVTWEEGKCVVFDDSFEHEVRHEGTTPRIVLLFDIYHPTLSEQERARLLVQRKSVDATIAAFMNEHGLAAIEARDGDVLLRPGAGVEAAIRRYMEQTNAVTVDMIEGKLRYGRG